MVYDYIIVGAGSAGCVLANRLTEDGTATVLLIEGGGSDRHILMAMPSALAMAMNIERANWNYESEPEPALGGRRISCPRGKVIGGSSTINGMVYIRGNPLDFDGWDEAGARGWAYRDVLPYFRRAETRGEGGDGYRGHDGPLHTSYGRLDNPLYRAFIEAGRQAGYPVTEDVNGAQQEGFGRMDRTVHNGRRWSAARAYLDTARTRKNLTVWTETLVERIAFEGRRAVGVVCTRGGTSVTPRARREVVLAGGAINSPQLLKLSGVGPARELAQHAIPLVADRPGVGANLTDHLEIYFQVAATQPITLYSSLGLLAKAKIGAQWLLTRDGLGATNHFESCAFIRSRPGVRWPDLQYHFLPAAISYNGKDLADRHGFQAHVGPMRSKSRGEVKLRSKDPRDKPALFFNYMSHPDDWTEMRAAVRLTREIFARPAFAPYRGEEIEPGSAVQSDDEIDAFIKTRVESAYHPCSTCRMGDAADPMAVVDRETRVIGLEALRVADSSIMPTITTGNLNAPTIMLAEKAADHIRGRPLLPASNAPFYEAPNWQSAQR
ncbi:choline dehydrogenase [Lichenifustis flavocetrariae]|uniref:Choline dehydrogenase n=1 Tax=Lichenifustis flavocetrariae TaxID=2949735 RepID=A0AA42CKS7_9HYPH|nr:choline dehydrogenase [Lichenifustis flavocetrariae]MCW6506662.1 choline dehydrogenase [Lichenifustis flavocetrariae]